MAMIGKFDDQNSIFGGKTDEGDQSDLKVDIVAHASKPYR
jgi:hypothetical protein